jgi:hypothetical protein
MAKTMRLRAVGGRADGLSFELPVCTVEFDFRVEAGEGITVHHAYRTHKFTGVGETIHFLAPKGWSGPAILNHMLESWQAPKQEVPWAAAA